jgi:hypothetical protein
MGGEPQNSLTFVHSLIWAARAAIRSARLLADAVLDTTSVGFRIGRLMGGEAPRDCMGNASALAGFWMAGLGD